MRTVWILAGAIILGGCASVPPHQKELPENARPNSIVNGAEVAVDWDFGLSNYEWNYAPWMRRFRDSLQEALVPPEEFLVGQIFGTVKMAITVEHDGEISDIRVIASTAPELLVVTSVESLKKMPRLLSLPGHFQDKDLEIFISLYYPELHRK